MKLNLYYFVVLILLYSSTYNVCGMTSTCSHPIPIPKSSTAIIKHSFNDLMRTKPYKAKKFLYLRYAVELGNITTMCNAIQGAGDLIDVLDEAGRTLLMWESALGNVNTVKALLWMGADPNVISPTDDMTALAFALINHHQDIVKILLDAGAIPTT